MVLRAPVPSRIPRLAAAGVVLLAAALLLGSCAAWRREPAPAPAPAAPSAAAERTLQVTATAYTSHPAQTQGDPHVTAFGTRLEPGMHVIAVSPDLYRMGLTEGTRVRIEGLPGEWVVADRMPARWQRRIDVYHGEDEAAARRFGRREVTLRWTPSPHGDEDGSASGR